MLLQIDGSVTAPRGFRASGDGTYALITCGLPAVCSGVFAKNRVLSAPVKWTSFLTEQYDTAQAIFICGNKSGIAVGDEGYADTVQLAEEAAAAIGISPEKVLLAAAGAAGVRFSPEEAAEAVAALTRTLSSEDGAGESVGIAVAPDGEAVELAVEFDIGEKRVRLGGVCRRGEAFALLTTDAAISKEMLDRALRADAEETFFMAMPDGSRGGDCILCAASGMAGNKRVCEEDASYAAFCAALRHVTAYLAKRVATTGRLLEVTVQNAADKQTASTLARAGAASVPLRRKAGAGEADFASLLAALGETDADFDPALVDISLRSTAGSVQLVRNGLALAAEDTASVFEAATVSYIVDVKNGNASACSYAGFIE